jgi:hypothetical protein
MKKLLIVLGLSSLAAACVPVNQGYYGPSGAVVISTPGSYGYGYPYGYGYGTGYGAYRRPVYYGRYGYGTPWSGPRYGLGYGQPSFGYPYGYSRGSYRAPVYYGHSGYGPRHGIHYVRPRYGHGYYRR